MRGTELHFACKQINLNFRFISLFLAILYSFASSPHSFLFSLEDRPTQLSIFIFSLLCISATLA